MALPHYGAVFNADQAKIYPLTVDSASTLTYGTAVFLTGVQNIQLNPDVLAKELYGDGTVQALAAKIRKVSAIVDYGQLSLDAIPAFAGSGAVVDTSTTPTQATTLSIKNVDYAGYLKLEARNLNSDIGIYAQQTSVNLKLYKCKMADFKVSAFNKEDFGAQQLTLSCIGTLKDTKIGDIVFNETAVALS